MDNENFKEALRKLMDEFREEELSEPPECPCPDCTSARIHNLQPYNPFLLEITRR